MVLYSFLCAVANKLLEYTGKKDNIITPNASTTVITVPSTAGQEKVPRITVTIAPESSVVAPETSVPNNTPYGSYCPNSFLGVPRDETRDKVLASCVPEETIHDHRGIFEPY